MDHLQRAAEMIPDGQIVVMRETSHFAPWQAPKEFNDVLRLLMGAGQ